MAGHGVEVPGDEVGGGWLCAVLCVSGSALAILALPSLFGAAGGPAGWPVIGAAGGGGLLASGILLSLGAPQIGAAKGAGTTSRSDPPGQRAV